MTRSAPAAFDGNYNLTALLGISLIRWLAWNVIIFVTLVAPSRYIIENQNCQSYPT